MWTTLRTTQTTSQSQKSTQRHPICRVVVPAIDALAVSSLGGGSRSAADSRPNPIADGHGAEGADLTVDGGMSV